MKGPIMPVSYDDDEGGVITRPKDEEKLREPEEYMVVLLNDNYTTKEFVVHILMLVFHKDPVEANRIMMNVHRKGRGVVGIYSYDIALTKADQVHAIAKEYEFPLRCIVEEV
ncbi:MAG: ATP-dependent Clp protease adaptor ClpS [Treponema sp.]|jgi:ATP-dependent Clp protease adaptor protein ClpS|nr:ATP-dependent Clp protease adaptor ClpS [Treponema sp.]